ncbi:MAG: carbohydrate ABC transporter permease [Oscillospiraceae bacterium]|nr:carbohydrate ABC transporter permease [Oscillospiraceae bacterium]
MVKQLEHQKGKFNKEKFKTRFSLYNVLVYTLFIIMFFIIIYPLYWIVIASISDPDMVNAGMVLLLPQGITFAGYEAIFTFPAIMTGFMNSIIYTVLGTTINVILTMMTGYVLSRKDMIGAKVLMIFFLIPMYFSGGLIPTFLMIDRMGLVDTIWVMVLPNALSIFNVILARTFFLVTIPHELLENARIEGCSNARFFISVAVPLSGALISLLTLFYAMGHWNSFFHALIYLRSHSMLPLQVILREILVAQQDNNNVFNMAGLAQSEFERIRLAQLIRYGIVVVSAAPLLIVYPFLQKYFEKGIMVGSVKG